MLAIKEMKPIEEDCVGTPELNCAGTPELNATESDCMDWYDMSFEDEICRTKLAATSAAIPSDKLFSMSTPRLTIVSMATPREPCKSAPESRKAFVPHWPYSSQWPFCRAPTTLELRGLPRSLTVQSFIAQLDSWGLAARCNFVHLQAGKAVVNTERHADGRELAGRLHNFSDWEDFEDFARPCKVAWSFSKQGLEELLGEWQEAGQVWHSDGSYTGPWVWYCGSWMPVVHPPEEDERVWVPVCVPVS